MKWVLLDIETNGLAEDCEILELAAHHVGKRTLELKGQLFDFRLVHDEEPPMDQVVREMHQKSGLLAELAEARAAIQLGHVPPGCVLNYEQLDAALYDFLSIVASNKTRSVYLVGNTVSFDWGIVRRRLPRSITMLSHRVIDVSVFRSQWQAWIGELVRGPVVHRARGDIMMSLDGLRWQKKVIEAGAREVEYGADSDFARSAHLAKPEDSSL